MFKHILIATDGSDLATKAVATGLNLAKSLGASVTFVTVTEPRTNLVPDPALVSSPADEYEATLTTAAMAILTSASAEASKHGIPCDAVHVRNDFPAEGILKEAESKGCDVIVMASHGRRGIARLVLGGEALRVLTNSAVPVLICR